MNKSSSENDAKSDRQSLIQPRTLKGFRDYLPETMIPREQLIETAREVYRSYGFSPIDTPALEYLEILSGKGGEESDRQLYQFQDHGGRDVGLRFDLTVPLARFAAQHIGSLGTPFKRYHIASVWRGENTQRGRYREFMQCDFDTIGTLSVVADIETGLVIHDLMQALGFTQFTIKINNRAILNGLLEKLDLLSQSTAILRALDKLPKIGAEKVIQEMVTGAGTTAEEAAQVLQLTEVSGSNEQILTQIQPLISGSEIGEEGLERLTTVVRGIEAAGVRDEFITLDVSIARGLDYYTRTTFEVLGANLGAQNALLGGGRYDGLVAQLGGPDRAGIGFAAGLERLVLAMPEQRGEKGPDVFIVALGEAARQPAHLLARDFRNGGVVTLVDYDARSLRAQMKRADKTNARYVVMLGDTELARDEVTVKDMHSGVQTTVSREAVVQRIAAADMSTRD